MPPAEAAAGLLSLPWDQPLAEWTDDRLVEIRQRGISRHVVRFVAEAGEVFAIKEIDERLARREHRLLRRLQELGIPAVEVLGVVADRPGLEAALVTRFLEFSTPYRNLFANPRGVPADRPAARRAGGAAGPAAPGRLPLGRLLAVEHAVPARRRRLRRVPGRRRDRRAAPDAVRRHARVRREPGLRAGRRRALRPAGRRAARRRRRPDRGGRAGPATGTRRCGRSWPGRSCCSRATSATGSPSGCAGSTSSASTSTSWTSCRARTATGCGCGPGSPSRASTGSCCSPGPASTPRRTRPAGCSTTSPASAAGWSRPRAGGWRRPRRPTAGSPRCTTR